MKKNKLAKNEYIDENGHVKKKGFFSWIFNYGYYYRSYLVVGLVVVGFFLALYFSMQSVRPDLKLYICVGEEVDETRLKTFCDNMYEYVIDIDSDDVVYMEPTVFLLVDDPITTSERSAYTALEKSLTDDDIVCFITDEYGYQYLLSQDAIRDLDFFGINSEEEYRLHLNDTTLWNGVNETRDFYLVMKKVPDEKYEDFYFSTLTTMVVDMCYDLVGEPEDALEA